MACTPQKYNTVFLRLPDLCRLWRRTENGISLYESKLFCHLRLNKNLLEPSHLVKPRNLLNDFVDLVRLSGKRRVRSAECGVWKMRSVENAECRKCGVWKMRSVENAECRKCGVWKMRSVENAECGKCGVLKKNI